MKWRLWTLVLGCLLAGCPCERGRSEKLFLYWAESSQDCTSVRIRSMSLDGSPPVDLWTMTTQDSITDLAVDKKGGKIYFSLGGSGLDEDTLRRVNLDGSGMEILVTYSGADRPTPRCVALDVEAGHLYWVAAGHCAPCPECGRCSFLARANLDGSQAQPIRELVGEHNPFSLCLLPDVLYWTDSQFPPQIQRAPLGGGDATPIYSRGEPEEGVYDVEVDPTAKKLYWIKNQPDSKVELQRANLDGSAVETIVTSESPRAIGLAVDGVAGKVYWTECNPCGQPTGGRILRANVDGTGREVVQEGLGVCLALELSR